MEGGTKLLFITIESLQIATVAIMPLSKENCLVKPLKGFLKNHKKL